MVPHFFLLYFQFACSRGELGFWKIEDIRSNLVSVVSGWEINGMGVWWVLQLAEVCHHLCVSWSQLVAQVAPFTCDRWWTISMLGSGSGLSLTPLWATITIGDADDVAMDDTSLGLGIRIARMSNQASILKVSFVVDLIHQEKYLFLLNFVDFKMNDAQAKAS